MRDLELRWLSCIWPVDDFMYALRRVAIGVMEESSLSEEDARQAVLKTWLAMMPAEGNA